MEIKIINLNNKTRKGTYIYLKEKNYPARYYEYKAGDIIDSYKEHYINTYILKNKKATIKQYKQAYTQATQTGQKHELINQQAYKYIEQLKNKPSVQKAIKTGITTTIIKNAQNAGNTQLKKAKTELLEPLVLDKQLLKLLIKDENFNKLKHRLEYQILGKGKNGEKRISATKFNTEPETIIEELKKTIKQNEETNMSNYIKKLELNAWKNMEKGQNGQINTIDLKIIFRKGK